MNKIEGAKSFNQFLATVNQAGTNDPVMTVLENDFKNVTIVRNGVGDYIINVPTQLTEGKTLPDIGIPQVDADGNKITLTRENNNAFRLTTQNQAGVDTDDILNQYILEFKVYNTPLTIAVPMKVKPGVVYQTESYFKSEMKWGIVGEINTHNLTGSLDIEYGTTEALGSTIALDPLIKSEFGQIRTVIMPKLAPAKYYYRFKATSEAGTYYTPLKTFTQFTGTRLNPTVYNVPSPVGGTTYYIDPQAEVNGDGLTDATPKNTIAEFATFGENNIYLFKRGSTLTVNADNLKTVDGVCKLGAYGDVNLANPKIIGTVQTTTFLQTDYRIIIDSLDISCTYKNANNMFEGIGIRMRNSATSYIYNCQVHGFNQCITTSPIGGVNGTSWAGVSIINTEIYDAALDGMYFDDVTDILVEGCYIHDVNLLYNFDINDATSAGDGIQASFTEVADGDFLRFTMRYTTIDRTATGNKFCVIYGAGPTTTRAVGIIEYNDFIMPTGKNCGGIYLDTTVSASTLKGNVFNGGTFGIHNRATGGITVTHNLFYNQEQIGISNIAGAANIYNNVFDQCANGYSVPAAHNIVSKNNYFSTTKAGGFHVSGNNLATLTSDYNHYYQGSVNTTYLNLDTMKVVGGKDANSASGNPFFEAGTYHPASNSPLAASGTSIPLAKDFADRDIPLVDVSKGLFQISVPV